MKKEIISYSTFLNKNENKNESSDKDMKLINNELYLNIDSRNKLKEESQKELKIINQRIQNFKEITNSKDIEASKEKLTNQIIKKFLNKLYPKCETSVKKISLLISREIRTEKKVSKKKVEQYINYFYSLRHDIKYSKALKLTKEIFRNIGYILCYIYSKLTKYSMKESGGIKECIRKIIEKKIDVLADFFFYCEENKLDPMQIEKTVVWKNLKKKYEIPPELIFLVNLFHRITIVDIHIEFDGEIVGDEDLKLFTITILNINYILPKLEQANLNFIHNRLQYSLYKRYYNKIFNILNKGEQSIKKNIIKNHSLMYNIKWDFEHEFNLEEYRKNENINQEIYINNIIYDKFFILCCFEERNVKNETDGKRHIFNSLVYNNSFFSSSDNLLKVNQKDKNNNKDNIKDRMNKNSVCSDNYDYFEIISEDENDSFSYKTTSREIRVEKEKDKNKEKEKENKKKSKKPKTINNNRKRKVYIELLEKNSAIFDIILMIICGITRIESIKKLNLLSNDFYNKDFINYMIKTFAVDIASIDDEFHILDMLSNKNKNIDVLNIEINCLDIISFDKIMEIISNNQTLNSLKMSFFSADVSYFTITLLKVYEEIKNYKEIIQYVINQGQNLTIDNFEEKMVNDISVFFIDNLYLLFEIIKNKKNLEILGLNFDLPSILINNMNYRIPIFKLLLNIILLIDNYEFKNKNKIKKLTLLSPHSIFDSRSENNIDLLFKDIRIYKCSKVLEELNIQFKFYNMAYIKNLISPNLTILSIGDLDLISFSNLVKYLTSYNFSSKSKLNTLNIKLLNIITIFNTEMKIILRELFGIKIKSLLNFKLFTNIIIKNKADYSYLIKILKYNWIPSYTITLNEQSKQLIDKINLSKENISFLVSPSIENIIFKDAKLKLKNRIGNNEEDELIWILKYYFNCEFSDRSLSFFDIQNLIFNILKYLYLTSNVKLSHKIEEES